MWVGNGRGGVHKDARVRVSCALDHTHTDLDFVLYICGSGCAYTQETCKLVYY